MKQRGSGFELVNWGGRDKVCLYSPLGLSDEDAFCLPGAGKAPFTWDSVPHFQGTRSGCLSCSYRFLSAFNSKQFICQSGTFGGMSCSPRPRVTY